MLLTCPDAQWARRCHQTQSHRVTMGHEGTRQGTGRVQLKAARGLGSLCDLFDNVGEQLV